MTEAVQEGDRIPYVCKETLLFLRSKRTGGTTTRYEWKKQVKSSSLLPSALCLLPCFLKEGY
ncbi:hypothetical protein NDI49_21040 [Trichocoleus sp. ST-U3]